MSSDILEEETLWTLRWSDIYWSLKVWYLCSAYEVLKRPSFLRAEVEERRSVREESRMLDSKKYGTEKRVGALCPATGI